MGGFWAIVLVCIKVVGGVSFHCAERKTFCFVEMKASCAYVFCSMPNGRGHGTGNRAISTDFVAVLAYFEAGNIWATPASCDTLEHNAP